MLEVRRLVDTGAGNGAGALRRGAWRRRGDETTARRRTDVVGAE